MNELDITFDAAPWEGFLERIGPGERVNGVELMALLEGEPEETVEDVFRNLEEKGVYLDLSEFPRVAGTGEAAVRLRREEQLVAQGMELSALETGDPLRLYLEEIGELKEDSIETLLAKCGHADESARTELMNAMLGTVAEQAKQYVGRGVLLMDLIQEGNLGLWQAICGYQKGDFRELCEKRVSFALAKTVIVQAIDSGVGQKMRRAAEDYRSVDQRLLAELGRNPTQEEIAQAMHITLEETAVIAKLLENIRMMDKAHTLPEPEEAAEEADQAVEDTAYFQMRQRIAELLADLPEQDAEILTARFGLEGGLPLTPEQTGRKFGLTPDEVIERESKALALLRHPKK